MLTGKVIIEWMIVDGCGWNGVRCTVNCFVTLTCEWALFLNDTLETVRLLQLQWSYGAHALEALLSVFFFVNPVAIWWRFRNHLASLYRELAKKNYGRMLTFGNPKGTLMTVLESFAVHVPADERHCRDLTLEVLFSCPRWSSLVVHRFTAAMQCLDRKCERILQHCRQVIQSLQNSGAA